MGRLVKINADTEYKKPFYIGQSGENKATEIEFDFTEWAREFGNGVIKLEIREPGDSRAHEVALNVSGTVATWIVTNANTVKIGITHAQLTYTANNTVKKSDIFRFDIKRGMM